MLCKLNNSRMDFPNCLDKSFITSSRWILKSPIKSLCAGKKRATNIATHRDNHIYGRDIGQKLTVLRLFHINAIDLLHQPHCILINLRPWFCSGRIALKDIGRKMSA